MPATDPTETTSTPSDAATEDAPPREKKRPRIGSSVGSAARMLGGDVLGNGDRAALRRISPEAPFTPALWKMLYDLEQQDPPGWFGPGARRNERQHAWERRWATLLMGMAFCARPQESEPRKQHLHDYETALGAALFEAGWSELRLTRLLRSTGEGLEVELRRVAQRLDSASQLANWLDVANLLFNQPDDASPKARDFAEKHRLSVARSYYRVRHEQESDSSDE